LDQPSPAQRKRSAGISAVLDVLDALDRHGPVTLAQLSRETGIAKSTLHRVCSTMGERGWVTRHPGSGNIELGSRVALLARANPASALTAGFYGLARTLIERHNETTCLAVLDGCESVFIAKHETTHAVRLVTAVGSRLPAFASASGRVMLADLPEHDVAAMYEGAELVTPTGRRLKGLPELVEILRTARERGYAENLDETALGLRCLAVPVGPPGRVAAAITLCVPSGRMDAARKRPMITDLLAAARALAQPRQSRSGQAFEVPRDFQETQSNNLCSSAEVNVADTAGARARRGPDHQRKVAQ
jgi:IclR family transcriptional regulator, KDG regulon repressor